MLQKIKLWTVHFNERLIERFSKEELPLLEKVIEKAIEKAMPDETIRYEHPLYHIVVVIHKIGLNGAELITCYKKEVS